MYDKFKNIKTKLKRYLKFCKEHNINAFKETYREWDFEKFFLVFTLIYFIFNVFQKGFIINTDVKTFSMIIKSMIINIPISLILLYFHLTLSFFVSNYKKFNILIDNFEDVMLPKEVSKFRLADKSVFYHKKTRYKITGADLYKFSRKDVRRYKFNDILDNL